MLLTALTASLEAAFNAWLRLDPQALPRLQPLQGKVIEFHLTGLELHLFFIPTSNGVQVMDRYGSPADVTLRGPSMAFIRLARSHDTGVTLLEQRLQVEGSMALAEQFSAIIRAVDIDWEEQLSHAVGDIVAHQCGQLARSGQGWLTGSVRAMRLNSSEYLQEESRLLPAQTEMAMYLGAVDTLRDDTERMEARIRRLQTGMQSAPSVPGSDGGKPAA
ncbi:MAG: SCP2 sterol-binding domain-containing protein [Thiothrix sp.]|nr:SCP2 sterol-binding domain-containing protein [Thiothrix sp.]HPQ94825.1 SCP2 sterol-binding domain-containing protein [Thiolinea sp.]